MSYTSFLLDIPGPAAASGRKPPGSQNNRIYEWIFIYSLQGTACQLDTSQIKEIKMRRQNGRQRILPKPSLTFFIVLILSMVTLSCLPGSLLTGEPDAGSDARVGDSSFKDTDLPGRKASTAAPGLSTELMPVVRQVSSGATGSALTSSESPSTLQSAKQVNAAAATASGAAIYRVTPASSKIKIDGLLNEEAWQAAAIIPLIYEWTPGDNIEPPVKTECLVAYDHNNLYIAFRCYDPEPHKIRPI